MGITNWEVLDMMIMDSDEKASAAITLFKVAHDNGYDVNDTEVQRNILNQLGLSSFDELQLNDKRRIIREVSNYARFN